MEVWNEMEIFVTLTKYNTHQWHEKRTHYYWWLLSQQSYCLPPSDNIILGIYEEWNIPINVHR